ncbi:MAG: ArsR/SmtB family transcription factor, partial [bacterium]
MPARATLSHAPAHVHIIDQRTVRIVRRRMKTDQTMVRLAETFAAFSDLARVKILYALAHAELCVCDLAAIVGVTDSAVSHQLRILRALGLVKYRRDGRVVYYSLADAH